MTCTKEHLLPDLTPDSLRTLTETLSDLTDYLRAGPDPAQALALFAPLVDEDTGLPIQLGDALCALARLLQDHPHAPSPIQVNLIAELRIAARELADQHVLHYVLDDLRGLYGKAAASEPRRCQCR
ncbi:hypothetical protein AB0F42_26320 [Streptomyces buecherae]|uniref:hypothetical protein n=1 Tax=Streptomyces buecherae TaxID=2763006 RepID=UPI0033EB2A0C